MKQLFFAGSFAIATFLAYGVKSNTQDFSGNKVGINFQADYDTTPKSKKDSMKMKKKWGKDSSMRKDSLHEMKDSTK